MVPPGTRHTVSVGIACWRETPLESEEQRPIRRAREPSRSEADDLGFGYTLEHGFAVREMASVFASLERLGEQEGQSPLPSWLLTHPAPGDRVRAVEARLAAVSPAPGQLRIGTQEYLQTVDGLVYGDNPRNGYFSEDRFLIPTCGSSSACPTSGSARTCPRRSRP